MSEFWVVGGVHMDTMDTDYDETAEDATEERYGPFWSYRDAEREWQRLSWNRIDDRRLCYQIVEEATLH